MRGIVLAGGTGSRLGDLTKVVNKHLLSVGGKPMIYWPIDVLKAACIDDITIVSTPRGIGQLAELLGGGYTYRVQDKPGGIVQAIGAAKLPSGNKDSVVVILGDNIFEVPPRGLVGTGWGATEEFACCFLKEVPTNLLNKFGVPRFGDDGTIRYITEKPDHPDSNYAVTGLYVFSPDVFNKISCVGTSARGETEITDLLNMYAEQGVLSYEVVDGIWADAGTLEGLNYCNMVVPNKYGDYLSLHNTSEEK